MFTIILKSLYIFTFSKVRSIKTNSNHSRIQVEGIIEGRAHYQKVYFSKTIIKAILEDKEARVFDLLINRGVEVEKYLAKRPAIKEALASV